MSIRITCTCGHEARVPDALAGKRILCDACRQQVHVPGGAEPVAQLKDANRRKRRKADEPDAPSRKPLWIGLGVGGVAALAGVVTLVLVLTRPGDDPISKAKAAQDPAVKPLVLAGAADDAKPTPKQPLPNLIVEPPVKPSAPEGPMLTEADKRLRAMFDVQLAQFGPARFEHEQFQDRAWFGVIVQLTAKDPKALGRFDAAAVVARPKSGPDVPAAILFTAGGRDGLAATATTLANSVGQRGDIFIGKDRFQPWPVGTFGSSASNVRSPSADTGRVHVPPGTTNYNTGDFLVALPLILEAGGGVEYGFVPGKQVRLGFLFPSGQEELTVVKLLGYELELDHKKLVGPLVAGKSPDIPPLLGAQQPPPTDGSTTLVEIGRRIVTPITDPLNQRVKEYFAPRRLAFAPGGTEFAGVGTARAAWRAEGGLIWGQDQRAETVSYSADGSKIYVVGDLQLTVYDRRLGKKTLSFQLGQPPQAPKAAPVNPLAPFAWKGVEIRDGAVVAPNGKWAFAPTADSTEKVPGKVTAANFGIRVYGVADDLRGKELRKFPIRHTAWVTCLALSLDGKQLLSGSEDHTVRLWEAATGKELKVFKGHTARIVGVGWSADGKRIVTAATAWDENLLQQLIAQKKPTEPALKDGTARVWDVDSGMEVFQIKSASGLSSAFLSPDGRFLGVGPSIWEVGQEKPRYTCPVSVSLLAFDPNGRELIGTSFNPPRSLVRFRFPEAAAVNVAAPIKPVAEPMLPALADVPLKTMAGLDKPAGDVRVLGDNKRAVSVAWDGMLRVWDLKEAKEHKKFDVGAPLVCMALRADGSIAVATGVPFNAAGMQLGDSGLVYFVNPTTGQKTLRVKDLPPSIRALTVSADGARMASAGGTLNLWDAAGRQLRPAQFAPIGELPHSGEIERVVFGPGGKRIITGGMDGFVKLWDPATLRCVQTLAGHGGAVNALALSRDGKHLLSGSADHTLILWELTKGTQVRSFTGHTDRVLWVSFLADGKRVASITENGETLLWNLTSGAALLRIKGPGERLRSATISADGKYAIYGTEEGPIKIAELPIE